MYLLSLVMVEKPVTIPDYYSLPPLSISAHSIEHYDIRIYEYTKYEPQWSQGTMS